MSELNEERIITCILCPQGCQISVKKAKKEQGQPDEETILSFSGQKCKRGADYARAEAIDPRRVLTTLVTLSDRRQPLPVRTRESIPQSLYWQALVTIHNLKLSTPIKAGDVLLIDLLETGIAVVATADLN
ncbi:MAG: DUF1667 domain-containing protein [Saccharofermentanales bacterium]|jgi:CxxC motif-containing protein